MMNLYQQGQTTFLSTSFRKIKKENTPQKARSVEIKFMVLVS